MALVLFVFSLVFGSCVGISRTFSHLPNEYLGYETSSELGDIYSDVELLLWEDRYNRLNEYFQFIFPFRYENYCVWINISTMGVEHPDTMLYMYIDECRATLPFDSVIDLMDSKNITVNYSYTGWDHKMKTPPKHCMMFSRNIQKTARK